MLKRMNLRLNLNETTSTEVDDFATPSTPCDDPGVNMLFNFVHMI